MWNQRGKSSSHQCRRLRPSFWIVLDRCQEMPHWRTGKFARIMSIKNNKSPEPFAHPMIIESEERHAEPAMALLGSQD